MSEIDVDGVMNYFRSLKDHRVQGRVLHPVENLLLIALCALICDCNDWEEVEEWGIGHQEFLSTFLDMSQGVPSHDTFNRFFNSLDKVAFAACFADWVDDIANRCEGDVVAIDGKTIRRSLDRAKGKSAIHIVSAWSSLNQLTLAQTSVSEKSNEIEAIPRLIKMLSLKGAVVTTDAMGCQRDIAAAIIEGGGDYLLALKGNHEHLYNDVVQSFEKVNEEGTFSEEGGHFSEQANMGHGREEWRRCWVLPAREGLYGRKDWSGLESIVRVESERQIREEIGWDVRYYISSLAPHRAGEILSASRSHWGIENQSHWSLDMTFREDESRLRTLNGAENMATIRKMALNLLKKYPVKASIKRKRKRCSWNLNYLIEVLFLKTHSAQGTS